MTTKGRTPWFSRNVPPARHGLYECVVMVTRMQKRMVNWGLLEWDGKGFLVPCPMVVVQWRGMTATAYRKATRGQS